jgi:hypothetical protein
MEGVTNAMGLAYNQEPNHYLPPPPMNKNPPHRLLTKQEVKAIEKRNASRYFGSSTPEFCDIESLLADRKELLRRERVLREALQKIAFGEPRRNSRDTVSWAANLATEALASTPTLP